MGSLPSRGQLVVATPGLTDPNFAHAVVLLLEHGAEGAVGVVLNRPTDVPVTAVMPPVSGVVEPTVVFRGGPVQPQAVIALAAGGQGQELLPGLRVADLRDGSGGGGVRLFAGYAGWGAGQLEGEIAAGGWFVVPARAEDALTAEPGELWPRVLARQGGLYTTACEDPTRN